MILQIARGIKALAFDVRTFGDKYRMADWCKLQLVIEAGQRDDVCCCTHASPWYLHGCWPGKLVGVDIAHPHKHHAAVMPSLLYDAHTIDSYGRVVFVLDDRFWDYPNGRYTGSIRTYPNGKRTVVNFTPKREPVKKEDIVLPDGYYFGNINCVPNVPLPPHVHKPKPEPVCELVVFDIELGPECSAHYLNQVVAQFPLTECGDICYGSSCERSA